jgi:phosphoribosylformylglycinamidine cyclo-ligase
VHSNGYSLVRRILSDARVSLEARPAELGGRTVAEVLLEPTRIYVKDVLALLAVVEVKGLAHITGSGLPGNVPRCLPEGTRAVLEARRWPRPPVFDWLQRLGGVSDEEMDSTFNMGLGMVAMVKPAVVAEALALLAARGVPVWEVGRIEASTGEPTAVVVR